jgi:hypothetical protein
MRQNVTGIPFDTLVPENDSAFKLMHEIISYEPAEAFSKELLVKLASLGIDNGQSFHIQRRPDHLAGLENIPSACSPMANTFYAFSTVTSDSKKEQFVPSVIRLTNMPSMVLRFIRTSCNSF